MTDAYSRVPDEVAETGDPVHDFLLLACLRYGEDDGWRHWERAAQLLAEHPGIVGCDIGVAAATADESAVEALLRDDPGAAARPTGPHGWEPLLYLAYARHDPAIGEAATLGTARLLLARGADPNAGYLWHGNVPPFTVLTGALGNGEGSQPAHPHAIALAGLLLAAGADPNDGQVLYNRQFGSDDSHLVLLFAHGLGRGDGGPWRARLGDAAQTPTAMVRRQLWWAVVHDLRERVILMIDNGVDLHAPFDTADTAAAWARSMSGRTPAEVAAVAGCPGMVELLVSRGAARPSAEGVDGFVAAALAADRPAVQRLRAHLDAARSQRPALIAWAAARGNAEAVTLLADLGFDVNALGRTDVPVEQPWETALHEAAARGDVALARLLLERGADPAVRDVRFGATPLDWARHFDRPAVVELLEPYGDPAASPGR
jgi:ankyrin repeat protein